ncbi:zinc finger protein 362 [Nephila pilipes]|uniref:Zinc finger protein 362 n=1 Tax=Nephila pilipes TaxID=299642 RepID=A0A8X6N9Q1_NEPPI|nr:zinc finger protein 362 [Nephila pilipes]
MQHHSREAHRGDIKPYQCQQCLKSFSSNHQLLQHIRIHTGEKPYKCSYCDRRFKQLSHVQQHTRLHTGERPYKCHLPECNRAFIQLSNLQQHLRNHESQVERAKNRPYVCNTCGKCFATDSSLRTHGSKVMSCSQNNDVTRLISCGASSYNEEPFNKAIALPIQPALCCTISLLPHAPTPAKNAGLVSIYQFVVHLLSRHCLKTHWLRDRGVVNVTSPKRPTWDANKGCVSFCTRIAANSLSGHFGLFRASYIVAVGERVHTYLNSMVLQSILNGSCRGGLLTWGVQQLDWPALFPDLYRCKIPIQSQPLRPKFVTKQTIVLLQEGRAILAATFQKIVESLSR